MSVKEKIAQIATVIDDEKLYIVTGSSEALAKVKEILDAAGYINDAKAAYSAFGLPVSEEIKAIMVCGITGENGYLPMGFIPGE